MLLWDGFTLIVSNRTKQIAQRERDDLALLGVGVADLVGYDLRRWRAGP